MSDVTYEYDIEGYYIGHGTSGWETVTCEATVEEAVEQRNCYRVNEPKVAFRIRQVGSDGSKRTVKVD